MKHQALDCSEKFGEAWISCMVLMVEGDVSRWTWAHSITAFKVACSSVLAYAALMILLHRENPILRILLMGVITAIFDFEVHPTHFGPVWAEAVATGFCTSGLGFAVHLLRKR